MIYLLQASLYTCHKYDHICYDYIEGYREEGVNMSCRWTRWPVFNMVAGIIIYLIQIFENIIIHRHVYTEGGGCIGVSVV